MKNFFGDEYREYHLFCNTDKDHASGILTDGLCGFKGGKFGSWKNHIIDCQIHELGYIISDAIRKGVDNWNNTTIEPFDYDAYKCHFIIYEDIHIKDYTLPSGRITDATKRIEFEFSRDSNASYWSDKNRIRINFYFTQDGNSSWNSDREIENMNSLIEKYFSIFFNIAIRMKEYKEVYDENGFRIKVRPEVDDIEETKIDIHYNTTNKNNSIAYDYSIGYGGVRRCKSKNFIRSLTSALYKFQYHSDDLKYAILPNPFTKKDDTREIHYSCSKVKNDDDYTARVKSESGKYTFMAIFNFPDLEYKKKILKYLLKIMVNYQNREETFNTIKGLHDRAYEKDPNSALTSVTEMILRNFAN